MQFSVERLGKIRSATVKIGGLTIICGPNNASKTYLGYALYGYLKRFESYTDFSVGKYVKTLLDEGCAVVDLKLFVNDFKKSFETANVEFSKRIFEVFSVRPDVFSGCNVAMHIDDEDIDLSHEFNIDLRFMRELHFYAKKKLNDSNLVVTINDGTPIADDDRRRRMLYRNRLLFLLRRAIFRALSRNVIHNAFALTSERSAVTIFQKELNIGANVLMENIAKLTSKDSKLRILEMMERDTNRYPLPIMDNIDFVRDYENLSKRVGKLRNTNVPRHLSGMLGGNFSCGDNVLGFVTKNIHDKRKNLKIPIHVSSSSVKSMLLFDLYVNSLSSSEDLLIIDEPELNLHPSNQRIMARIIASIVNSGISVFMTTHSDYIIRELNILMMLNEEFEGKDEWMKRYEYDSGHPIDKNSVSAYVLNNGALRECDINRFGIEIEPFDSVIDAMNENSDQLVSLLGG